jgi:2,3-bisphosphoglycerate-independent phosphoglycerate mutase
MKIVVLVGDGMGDLPQPELGGKTPLESAFMPHANFLARTGTTGLVRTCFRGMPVESAVANMGILGFDPRRFYPIGRASFEAMARGISLQDDDIVLRCNLISVDSNGRIADFTAGQIGDGEALSLIGQLVTGQTNMELYSGQSYRNLLILRGARVRAADLLTSPPHLHIGHSWENLLVRPRNRSAEPYVSSINNFLRSSLEQITELNRRVATRASMCWVWSPSEKPSMPSFQELHGITGTIVCGIDSIRGIGIAGQMTAEPIPEATGYSDTNLQAKLTYAIRGLQRSDFVYIHVNAPDEESHQHSLTGKMAALERIDRELIGPLLHHLRQHYPGQFRVAFLPDHTTRLSDGQHQPDPVPFLIYGTGMVPDRSIAYGEREIQRHSRLRITSLQLIPMLLA